MTNNIENSSTSAWAPVDAPTVPIEPPQRDAEGNMIPRVDLIERLLEFLEGLVVQQAAKEKNVPPEYYARTNSVDGWDQSTWRNAESEDRCGTSMCLAGWTIQLSGLPWAVDGKNRSVIPEMNRGMISRDQVMVKGELLEQLIDDPVIYVYLSNEIPKIPQGVGLVACGDLAGWLLGVGYSGCALFDVSNTLPTMWRITSELRIQRLVSEARGEVVNGSTGMIQ